MTIKELQNGNRDSYMTNKLSQVYQKKFGLKKRQATDEDKNIFKQAGKCLNERQNELMHEWGMAPVPNELIPTPCHSKGAMKN